MGRTVPSTLKQHAARQLGRTIAHSTICSQLMAKCDDEKLTIQTPNGKQAKNDMGGKKDDGTNS